MDITSDYIVVGAGSGGSVVTRRLLEQGHSVHVIEAGRTDTDPRIQDPGAWPALLGGTDDWAFSTTPQRHANGRSLFWPRGRMLGGTSSLNAMMYVRGHRSDYDRWAAEGCTGWDFDSVLPLFLRSEDHAGGANQWHGTGGPLPVERLTDPHPTTSAFVEAAMEAGLPRTDDVNAERMIGVGHPDLTIRNGQRASVWRSFVASGGQILGDDWRIRLTTEALVHRVILENGHATGVEYSVGGRVLRARAEVEVVLSAGSVMSPKILMLSGIGPAAHLGDHGLDVAVDLPGVGANLHDHPLVSNVYETDEPLPPGRNNLVEGHAYATSRQSAGPGPDLQPVFLHAVYPAEGYPVPEHGYTIVPTLVRPRSRGTLRLASADPAAAPLSDPNVLAESYDMEALVDAVELGREIGGATAFKAWRKAEVAPGPQARTRDDLREYVRRAVGSYHHQVGTCRMGVGADAVVGPDLRVRGVTGLRVADASIMPSVTSGNTNAPTIMIGEKAADLILLENRA